MTSCYKVQRKERAFAGDDVDECSLTIYSLPKAATRRISTFQSLQYRAAYIYCNKDIRQESSVESSSSRQLEIRWICAGCWGSPEEPQPHFQYLTSV